MPDARCIPIPHASVGCRMWDAEGGTWVVVCGQEGEEYP